MFEKMNDLPLRERTIFEVSKEGPDHLGQGMGILADFCVPHKVDS